MGVLGACLSLLGGSASSDTTFSLAFDRRRRSRSVAGAGFGIGSHVGRVAAWIAERVLRKVRHSDGFTEWTLERSYLNAARNAMSADVSRSNPCATKMQVSVVFKHRAKIVGIDCRSEKKSADNVKSRSGEISLIKRFDAKRWWWWSWWWRRQQGLGSRLLVRTSEWQEERAKRGGCERKRTMRGTGNRNLVRRLDHASATIRQLHGLSRCGLEANGAINQCKRSSP